MYTKKLIAEVKRHDCLWSKTNAAHRNYRIRNLTWAKISYLVGETEQTCRKRWRNLRDQFIKEFTKCPDSEYVKWAHFESLYFLKDIIRGVENKAKGALSKQESTSSEEDEEEEDSDLDEQNDFLDQMEDAFGYESELEQQTNLDNLFETEMQAQPLDADEVLLQDSQNNQFSLLNDISEVFTVEDVEIVNNDTNVKVEDPLNNSADKLMEMEENISSSSIIENDPFLSAIGEYFAKIPEEHLMEFKMNIVNYVHKKFKEL